MARREAPPLPPRNDSLGEPVLPVAFAPRPGYALNVPRTQLKRFANESQDENGETRVISFFFANISGLFPNSLPTTTTNQKLT